MLDNKGNINMTAKLTTQQIDEISSAANLIHSSSYVSQSTKLL